MTKLEFAEQAWLTTSRPGGKVQEIPASQYKWETGIVPISKHVYAPAGGFSKLGKPLDKPAGNV